MRTNLEHYAKKAKQRPSRQRQPLISPGVRLPATGGSFYAVDPSSLNIFGFVFADGFVTVGGSTGLGPVIDRTSLGVFTIFKGYFT